MKLKLIALSAACAAMLATTSVSYAGLAQSGYVGARVGWARLLNPSTLSHQDVDAINDLLDLAGETAQIESTKWEKNAWGGGLYGGYNFYDWFALEANVNYFGHFKHKTKYTEDGDTYKHSKDNLKLYGMDVTARFAYTFDTNGSDVFFRIGPSWLHSKFAGDNNNTIGGVVGAGVQYAFTQNFAMRFGYDYYFRAFRGEDGFKSDMGFLYLGAHYQFGGPSAPAPVQREVSQTHTLDAGMLFGFDSSKLTAQGQQTIADVATASRRLDNPSFQVYGYTDRIGSDAYNQKLSERRAATVAGALESSGVAAGEITVVEGRGKSNPVTGDTCNGVRGHNALVKCLAPDRRVEVVVNGVETVNQQ